MDRNKFTPLQLLQPSAQNQQILVGRDGLIKLDMQKKKNAQIQKMPKKQDNNENEMINSNVKNLKPSKKSSTKESSSETAYDLMVNDEIPLEYWKELAEQRRIALEAALIENEELHTQISKLELENEELKEVAKHAENLAEILKNLTEEYDENED